MGVDDLDAFLLQPLDRLERELEDHAVGERLSRATQSLRNNRRSVAADIVSGVSNETFSYLAQCKRTLLLSTTGATIFDRHRKRVDDLLVAVAPDVLDKLNAAIDRTAVTDDPEARAHALTSCRRVLTEVADVVFPASDDPHIDGRGVEHEVGASQYLNRILAGVESSSSATHGRALSASLEDLVGRLDRLDDLLNKGVHADPSAEDVEFGVIQTYLLAGRSARCLLGLSRAGSMRFVGARWGCRFSGSLRRSG